MASLLSADSIEAVRQYWDLVWTNETPYRTRHSHIRFATRHHVPVAVKWLYPTSDAQNAEAALLHFQGNGIVTLLDSIPGILLLERIIPGDTLASQTGLQEDTRTTQIIANTMTILHRQQAAPTTYAYPSVEDLCLRVQTANAANALPRENVARAIELSGHLNTTIKERVLLHGDLHHGNLIRDFTRGWVAIDPKGIVGEPAFEAAPLFYNPLGAPWICDKTVISDRLHIVASVTGLDIGRLQDWAYVGAILSALWSVEDGEDPTARLQIAALLDSRRQ